MDRPRDRTTAHAKGFGAFSRANAFGIHQLVDAGKRTVGFAIRNDGLGAGQAEAVEGLGQFQGNKLKETCITRGCGVDATKVQSRAARRTQRGQ